MAKVFGFDTNQIDPRETRGLLKRVKIAVLPLLLGLTLLVSGCGTFGKNQGGEKPETPEDNMYTIYTEAGEKASFDSLVAAAAGVDVVLIGETHNNHTAHLFERAFMEALFMECRNRPEKKALVLSLEFFEKDVQTVLNEYLSGIITEMHFLMAGRPSSNYHHAYKPLVEFSKKNKIPVVAANAPRRYVNLVSRKGVQALDTLSTEAKSWLAPLPYNKASEKYQQKLKALGSRFHEGRTKKTKLSTDFKKHPHQKTEALHGEDAIFPGINPDAQSLWDATMAWSIVQALGRKPENLVIHINGKFHSDEKLGIPEHLNHYRKEIKILTISFLLEKALPEIKTDRPPLADFIITTSSSTQHPKL